ncbi:hypothetical protein CEE37_06995 [candidate division LCP-89 bacterium B3_LCP]|uniref:FlgD Ig-like domain-containing protein n=1 Tax=candidate division LCP-89 bacterium B3_LCP TaxID=2012998 RepID=A0A532V0G1_UNCL8|nr:MAG: hypothetical protein CEE37_06995 [candidate division LCP-89 bacterium B3_LCP]
MKTLTLILLAFAVTANALNPMYLVGDYAGESAYNYFGHALTAGDFDDDGMEEFVIGAYGWNNNTGKNYFYQYDNGWPAEPYMTVQGSQEYESYDYSDANLGDINDDGIPDLGIPIYGFNPQYIGGLDLYFGTVNFDTIADWSISPSVPILYFANYLDSCGDVNNDGGNDFILTSSYVTDYSPWTELYFAGEILDTIPDWLIPDDSAVSGIGDINNDGYCDLMLQFQNYEPLSVYFGGNPMDTIPDVILYAYPTNWLGEGVGDINGDDYPDICASMHLPDTTGIHGVIYFGGPDFDAEPDFWLLDEWGEPQPPLYSIGSGDFNGDGINDILSGTAHPWYGRVVYIYLGSPWFNGIPDALVTGGSIIFNFGDNVASGDIDGDGSDELLVTSSNGYSFNTGRVRLFRGPEEWIDYGAGVKPGELPHQPGWFTLDQNFPNPFNAATTIHFELGKASLISLIVYDLQGNRIKELIKSKEMILGGYNVSWTGRNETGQPVSSGIYLLELLVDEYREVRKMVLVR